MNVDGAGTGVGVGEEVSDEGVGEALGVSEETGVSVCAVTKEGTATMSESAVEKNNVKNRYEKIVVLNVLMCTLIFYQRPAKV